MTREKSSSHNHQGDAETSATHPERGGQAPSGEPGNVSEDLNRIASYLTEKQVGQSTRTHDLGEELTHRLEEKSRHDGAHLPDDDPFDVRAGRHVVIRSGIDPLAINPVLAARLEAFCHDLDDMLDRFRAQVEYKNSVKH